MPHVINIDGVSESLFILQSLAHASPSFCRAHNVAWERAGESELDWTYYFGWLKSLSCDRLIQVATKLRMLEDILKANDVELDFAELDATARKGIAIGSFERSKKVLTLRESWNKVIHATGTQLAWKKDADFEYWTGCVWLTGKRGVEDWKVALHVEPFCHAMVRYVRELEEKVDWYHLYKHDT